MIEPSSDRLIDCLIDQNCLTIYFISMLSLSIEMCCLMQTCQTTFDG